MGDPHCSCKLTRVRPALQAAAGDDISFVFSKEVDGCDLSKYN